MLPVNLVHAVKKNKVEFWLIKARGFLDSYSIVTGAICTQLQLCFTTLLHESPTRPVDWSLQYLFSLRRFVSASASIECSRFNAHGRSYCGRVLPPHDIAARIWETTWVKVTIKLWTLNLPHVPNSDPHKLKECNYFQRRILLVTFCKKKQLNANPGVWWRIKGSPTRLLIIQSSQVFLLVRWTTLEV